MWQWIGDANETGAGTARENETERGKGIATAGETGTGTGKERGTGTGRERERGRKGESDRVLGPGLLWTGTVDQHPTIGRTEIEIVGGSGKGAKEERGVERETEVGNEKEVETEEMRGLKIRGVRNGETKETAAMDWMAKGQPLWRSLSTELQVRPRLSLLLQMQWMKMRSL